MGHALMENRSGLVVQAHLSQASGTAEREAAIHMVNRQSPGSSRRITLGADKGYDAASFVDDLRQMAVTPHIAKNDAVTKTGKRRRGAIDARTTRHPGYGVSQRAQADRRSLRLGEDSRRPHQDEAARHEARRVQVHLYDGCL
jgi:hypothetical protein